MSTTNEQQNARDNHEALMAANPGLRALNDGVSQCEQHPGVVWPHGDCAGPGMPLMETPPIQEND